MGAHVDTMDYVSPMIVTNVGSAITVSLFVAPMFTTFLQVMRMRAVDEGLSPDPYITSFFNCLLWILYAMAQSNSIGITVNAFGALSQAVYTLLFTAFCTDQVRDGIYRKRAPTLAICLIGTVPVWAVRRGRDQLFRSFCGCTGVAAAVVPMIRMNPATVDSLGSLIVAIISVVNGALWTWYAGYGTEMIIWSILAPNLAGAVCGLIKVGLYIQRRYNPPAELPLQHEHGVGVPGHGHGIDPRALLHGEAQGGQHHQSQAASTGNQLQYVPPEPAAGTNPVQELLTQPAADTNQTEQDEDRPDDDHAARKKESALHEADGSQQQRVLTQQHTESIDGRKPPVENQQLSQDNQTETAASLDKNTDGAAESSTSLDENKDHGAVERSTSVDQNKEDGAVESAASLAKNKDGEAETTQNKEKDGAAGTERSQDTMEDGAGESSTRHNPSNEKVSAESKAPETKVT